jgi:3-oxoacyl-[acyl-carrier protein] reductase
MDRLDGKVVLITGGTRGIGYVTAQAFLQQGAQVAICGKNPVTLAAAEKHLTQLGDVAVFHADVRHAKEVQSFVAGAIKRFGNVDVLVANAGRAWMGPFAEESLGGIDEMVDVNLKGLLFSVHAVLPGMLKQRAGVIVNISSGLGKAGLAGFSTYCATKFGVLGFTESLAQEVEGSGVKVYAVCPGAVATDMQVEISGEKIGIAPEKVAQAILKLVGHKPPIRCGECLEVYC